MDADTLHDLAIAAGATVLGDPSHYLLTAEQLGRVIAAANKPAVVPPCPVPVPSQK